MRKGNLSVRRLRAVMDSLPEPPTRIIMSRRMRSALRRALLRDAPLSVLPGHRARHRLAYSGGYRRASLHRCKPVRPRFDHVRHRGTLATIEVT